VVGMKMMMVRGRGRRRRGLVMVLMPQPAAEKTLKLFQVRRRRCFSGG